MNSVITIPQGTRCLSIPKCGEKLSRGKSWVWEKIKNDQSFPKPIRLAGGMQVLLEHEVDSWLMKQVQNSRNAA